MNIHPSVRRTLGYSEEITDEDLLGDWKRRSAQVCKPCWELKYCPYGPLVEQAPVLPCLRQEAKEGNEYYERCLETGEYGERRDLDEQTKAAWQSLVEEARRDLRSVAYHFKGIYRFNKKLEEATDPSGEAILDILELTGDGDMGPMGITNLPFPLDAELMPREDIEDGLLEFTRVEISRMERAIEDGFIDDVRPLDEARRDLFSKQVDGFNSWNCFDQSKGY